jgi:hypothetical protein
MNVYTPPQLFRTWDMRRNEWYGASCDEVLTLKDYALFGECTYFCPPSIGDLQYIITTQYSGLDDINSVKVYAGDIGRVLNGREWSIGEVHYINGIWKVGSYALVDVIDRLEIVGNIFEA